MISQAFKFFFKRTIQQHCEKKLVES